ncbi:MAG: hypothetical protein BMS9Abin37_2720 [Acidobacteriota bacterium]|nr:MAG: hypothetical protein BMS9Abin37_2720 [Acidobacteriota bacterium]
MARKKSRKRKKQPPPQGVLPQPRPPTANRPSRSPGKTAVIIFGLVALVVVGASGWLLFRAHPERVAVVVPDEPPNVLLISVDTLRADHIGAYGASVATPNIDAMAARGVVFEWAVSHVPITLPSHASLLTGSYPIWHGVRDNGAFRLEEEHETLSETARAAGYRTAAFVGSFALDSRFGLDQGFELYDDFYGDASELNDFGISERPAEAVLEPALKWLTEPSDEPYFAFIHLYDPHVPYAPPQPFRDEHREDLYTGEIAYVDAALGRFWNTLRAEGLLDNTLVLFTSDHGEALGEHGESSHGMFAYEATLRVPLIATWEGVLPAGTRVPSRVRLIDVAPSVTELLGLPAVSAYQGASLIPLIEGTASGHRESYFEAMAFNLNRNWAPLTGLYRGSEKFIDLPIPELYELDTDPGETTNIIASRAKTARDMREALEELVAESSTEASRSIQTAEVDRETMARLEALGYLVVADTPDKPTEYTEADDPKQLIYLSDRLDDGVARHLAGDSEEAVRIFRSIIEERPSFANAYTNLAYVLRESGHLRKAIEVLEQAIARGLQTRTMLGRLGAYLQEAGDVEESVSLLEALVQDHPNYAEAYNFLSVSYAKLGRTEDAVRVLDELLRLDSSYASGYANRGSVYLGAGRTREAEENFRRALEIDPRLAGAWNGLGVIAANENRHEDAITAWRRSVELDPKQYDTIYNLGLLLTQLNRISEAMPYLEAFIETAPPDRYAADIPKVRRLMSQLRAAWEKRSH